MSIAIGNIVRMGTAALGARLLGTRRPLNLMLALTDRCTGRCNYCKIPERGAPEMTTPEILRMLSEASAMGCQRLGLWGGEPLLRDDLGEIISHANKLGMWVTVDTNGHLVPQQDRILAKADHLNITLDGDQQAHDAGRGEGSWERTMAGIEHARGRYLFWTITVLGKHNLDQVDWILDLAGHYKFLTTFQVLHHNDQLGDNDPYWPGDDEYRQVLRKLLRLKEEGAPIATSKRLFQHLLDWPDFHKTRLESFKDYPDCLAGRLYCNVDVSGGLYPCSLYVDEVEAPNVTGPGGFKAAWQNIPPATCRACSATCFTEYNYLYGLDWRVCLNWIRALRS